MRRRLLLVLASTLVLALTACSPGEQLAEELAEQALEQEGGGDVEIDSDSGEVSIESDDGSATFGGGDVPDDFPIDVPGGGEVLAVMESGDDSTLSLTYEGGDIDAIIGFYEDWVADSGLDVANKIEVSNPRGVTWSLTVGEGAYTISVAEGGGNDVALTIFVVGG